MANRVESDTRLMIEHAYAAFNKRDIDSAIAAMTTDVQWSNGWEGGYVHGREGVRDYWTRQWQELDPIVEPVSITRSDDGHVVVSVNQVIRQPDGVLLRAGLVEHVYTIRDGLIARMDIREAAEADLGSA
jgi:hypothetical protein